MSRPSAAAQALQETEDAIARVLDTSEQVELTPQVAYIRRLQHQSRRAVQPRLA